MSVLQRLTEGVVTRDVRKEGEALLSKWEQTGLLEGLNDGQQKQGMAVLLENQAKELLREASSMAAGDVEGFAAVAFPIVRRVFGGLIANDLVSVQPMSLPSGLIFFLDFTHEDGRNGAKAGDSVYGGNVVGREITGGVNLGLNELGTTSGSAGGHYDFGHAYTSVSGSSSGLTVAAMAGGEGLGAASQTIAGLSEAEKKEIKFDADVLALGQANAAAEIQQFKILASTLTDLDTGVLQAIEASDVANGEALIRRLTKIVTGLAGDDGQGHVVLTVVHGNAGVTSIAGGGKTLSWPKQDQVDAVTSAPGAVLAGAMDLEEPNPGTGNGSDHGSTAKNQIAEIDIKVDSIAVTAQTKKLKAKWSPELGQDLNAYHNLDAEVELTGILSEQIALEIDRELLGELVDGATAGTRYWSRAPGLFVDSSGDQVGATTAAPDFTGTVSEWYETLIETINDVSAQIHRKTLRGGANFVVCSPEVANILEFTSGFRASVTADQDRGTIGAVRAGSLSKKFDVYVDPYFLRNVILVGRKGSSFLESGFVYAPYVPLQVTPTIFGTEDFVPRKGVMTRYAKKMVRPDMYGLVVVRGLLGEEG
jgi:hypothetical protein